jgi:hypothetical protein
VRAARDLPVTTKRITRTSTIALTSRVIDSSTEKTQTSSARFDAHGNSRQALSKELSKETSGLDQTKRNSETAPTCAFWI